MSGEAVQSVLFFFQVVPFAVGQVPASLAFGFGVWILKIRVDADGPRIFSLGFAGFGSGEAELLRDPGGLW